MTGRGGRSAGGGGAALVFVSIFGALVMGGSAAVWLAGVLGGVVAGGGPQVIGLGEASGVLARLPRHLGDPAAAWPGEARGELPGRTGMTAALAIAVAVVALALLVIGTFVWRARRGPVGRRRGAGWASRGQLRELRVRRPQRGRLILGRHEGRLLAAEPRASAMIVAPAQAGKTTGLLVPALLEWNGPALATSVKGDLVHDTYAARSRCGEVLVFDPTGATGLTSAAWSPIAASRSWGAARRTAARLLQVGERGGGSPDEAFWRPAAARYLAPLLLAAAHERTTMGDVLSWIARTDHDAPRDALSASADPGATAALDALESVWDADPRFRSSVVQTAATALDAWQEPSVAAATEHATITAQWLLEGHQTLYLVAPAHDQRRLRGLSPR
jgi:type IV secretion system protein VirD4